MSEVAFKKIDGDTRAYFATVIILAILVAMGGYAFWQTYTQGHGITNMNNRVPWGLLIAGVVFSIGLSAGALHVFTVLIDAVGIKQFKAFSRMAPFVAAILILGALIFIFLDIGKVDHGMNVTLYFNPTSVFSWNAFLYSGYLVLCILYMLGKWEERWRIGKIIGIWAFSWAVIVHSGTGLIIGFVYGRELYHTAIHAPLFIASAIASGLGLMMFIIFVTFNLSRRYIAPSLVEYLAKIWGATIIVVLFLLTAEALEKAYVPANKGAVDFTYFTPFNAGLWFLLIVIGLLIPLAMIVYRGTRRSLKWMTVAGLLHVAGVWAERFLVVVPGLRYPSEYLPGYEMYSLHTMENGIVPYFPSPIEWMLFIGVFALVGLIYVIGIKIWDIVPETTEGLE